MREETIMASVVKHTADLMQENYKLKADLKTAHEMIREFREELRFYGNGGNFNLDLWEHPELGHFTGKRARAVLQKWQGKL